MHFNILHPKYFIIINKLKRFKMKKFKKIFDNEILNKRISEAYHLVEEYRMFIKEQLIGIKVYENLKGKFSYDISHYYQSIAQASPYVSSINGNFDSVDEALMEAKMCLFNIHYKDNIEHQWIKNEFY